ncbi:MauE/DoxX family redox-associated membrane protein [Streptomyces sp. NPDC091281]|uniref:MauE/DoxX family redox-associated membrane protein n=1 Tax=Streptomyces sp. NPDC091281 TaxID=3365985 RepID=UPI003807F5B2
MAAHLVEAFGRLCLITVFAWSGVQKVHGFRVFRGHVAATVPRLGGLPSDVLAAAVVLIELGIVASLVLRPLERAGLTVALLLLTAFTAYLLRLLRTRPDASCGCAGTSRTPVSGAHLLRNALLLVLTVATWWAAALTDGPSPAHYALAAAPAAVTGVVLLHLAELVSLVRTTYVT